MRMHTLRQAGLTGLLLALVAVLESKSAVGAYQSVIDHVSGLQHAALSAVCALCAFVFSAVAGAFKFDERPYVRSSATLARIVSVAFLLVPIGYLGSALKHDRIERDWAAYVASDAYRSDVEMSQDHMADSLARNEASARLAKPSQDLSPVDGEWWLAGFFQIVLITAAGIRLPAPATADEIKHWRAVVAARKGAETKRRRKAAKAKGFHPKLVASK